MEIPTINNSFRQIDYGSVGAPDGSNIFIVCYSNNPSISGIEIFAGENMNIYFGDGKEDPLYSEIITLERPYKLSEQKKWIEFNPEDPVLGKSPMEIKFDLHSIVLESENANELERENDMMEKPNESNEIVIPKWLVFSPNDPEMSLEDAMKLWLSIE